MSSPKFVTCGTFAIDVDLNVTLAMIGAAITSRAPLTAEGQFRPPCTHGRLYPDRAEYFHSNIGAYASRKHFNSVDDWLRENIAPTWHLDHAAHLVIYQIAFRSRLPWPEEYLAFERFSNSSRDW